MPMGGGGGYSPPPEYATGSAVRYYAHIAMINRQASKLLTKLLIFHRFHGRHSNVLIVS